VADDSTNPFTANLGGLFSAGSAGVSAFGTWFQGEGTAAGDTYQAEREESQAQYAKTAAVETGAALSQRLQTALGNIDAMRAAAGTSSLSPTGNAVRDTQENLGLSQKAIAVDKYNAQAQQDQSDAAYLRTAGKFAIMGGDIGAAGGLLKAVSSATPYLMAAAPLLLA
jgi:hypothetical protein